MPLDDKMTLQQFRNQRQTARDLALKGADLRGIQLAGLRADGLDLTEADLRACSLCDVTWRSCILRDARLDGADLTGATLRMCDLDGARAPGATFARARLENSSARGARLDGANFTEAVLTDTDLSRASLSGANLTGAAASGAAFRGADLRGAVLRDADLSDADLRGADLTDADLAGVDLHGADLRGVLGDHLALREQTGAWAELPPAVQPLAETMTPIVQEVLRTAGRSGALDPKTAVRLRAAAAKQRPPAPGSAPSPDTMAAVMRALGQLGDSGIPTLLGALGQPGDGDPPAEIQSLILRLRDELGLDATAGAEDVLARIVQGFGRPPQES